MKHNKKSEIKIKKRHNLLFWSRKLIKTGGHLGRRPFKVATPRLRHSFIDRFLLGSRDNSMLINTSTTIKETNKGLWLAAKILRHGGRLLIVDTRADISSFLEVIENGFYVIPSVLSFSGSRWVGGTVSNWKMISQMVYQFGNISRQINHFVSKDNIPSSRYRKMKTSYPGFLEKNKSDVVVRLNDKPDLIFVVNPNESRHVIQEAVVLKIPVIALVDSNTNLDGIKIPIPVNYDTLYWVHHCADVLVRLARCIEVHKKKIRFPFIQPFPFQEKKTFTALSSFFEKGVLKEKKETINQRGIDQKKIDRKPINKKRLIEN